MKKTDPIGIFDSGVGGLTVVNEIVKLLPHENLEYFADNQHAPYGNKSPGDVLQFAEDISADLIQRGAKMIVVACNTATGIAIHHLRKQFSIPFVGMEPAVKPAAESSQTGKIGVLATANTFEADHFKSTRNRFANHVEVFMAVGDGLVELIEQGKSNTGEVIVLLEKYLRPMISNGIDQLVLGCTHYPFLIPAIQQIVPESVIIHDPAPAVVRQVKRVLEDLNLTNEAMKQAARNYRCSGDQGILREMVKSLEL